MNIIEAQDLQFTYAPNGQLVLDHVNITIATGSFIAIIGANGSGKSTFAHHLNALLLPTGGKIMVQKMDSQDRSKTYAIRQKIGLLLQNPDDQIVATLVEEDLAFGLNNLELPHDWIKQKVADAVQMFHLEELCHRSIHTLSAGQKQRVALAGLLVMEPDCLVLDECTSMLDPLSRQEIMQIVRNLGKNLGMTIIWITQDMEEAALADRILVLDQGRLMLDGPPKEVFSNVQKLGEYSLDVPPLADFFYQLHQAGLPVPLGVWDIEKCVDILWEILAEN